VLELIYDVIDYYLQLGNYIIYKCMIKLIVIENPSKR